MSRPKRRKHLTVDDSFWMWLESPETPMQVAALAIFAAQDEPATAVVERIVTAFRCHRDVDPRFRSLLGYRRFPRRTRLEAAEHIDTDRHLHHHALSGPGGEHKLAQLISRLHSDRLDPRRPMWEVHVIDGLDDNRFAIYLKAHHALINGVDAVRLFGRSLATDADAPITAPVWATVRRSPTKATAGRRRPSRVDILTAIARATKTLWRAGYTDSPLVGPFAAPRSPLNVDEIGPNRQIATAAIELGRIKRLAKRSDTTVNDIVLTACATALRRYMIEIADLPDRPLVLGCPVSIAPEGSATASSIGIMFVDSATDEPDAGVRLSRISASTRAAKQHQSALPHAALVGYAIVAMAPHTLRQLVPGAVAHVPPTFNLIVSNVPGPDRPLYLAGARMVEMYPLSLLFKGEVLNITAVSYDGRLHFGFIASRTALPDVARLTRYLGDAFDELEDRYATVLPDLARRPAG
ncbi:wax ester/triacylglycerol synthase family O-acyltransferase [Nocardia pseudovaccinii]|uniref:wax ester/triacylglycerol synthase family O-acyltransferase n=1 Tax=Nocardia pseudovaccinii TaxID=189540 RepID=UPI0007A4DAD9|nr:wax ester/triacylglycerol synthase family O-acyltransferase [Nocardia pseudovaccinii]